MAEGYSTPWQCSIIFSMAVEVYDGRRSGGNVVK